MRKHIPNIITLVNLFCGCCAVVSVFNEMYVAVFWFLFVGGLADYADGLVARKLNVHSVLGKELDSLADMVSFGVVPGAILYMMISSHPIAENYTFELSQQSGGTINLMALPAFLITLFSALRLAKFNLDTRQSEDFIGLNTPSVTMFVTGLMLIYEFDSFGLGDMVFHPYFLYPLILILSYLLVAELPMFSMKFKGMKWQGNERRIIFLILALVSVFFLREVAFSLMITLYVLFSFFDKLVMD
ncbi:MAG TPA: CDP-diacylglycerol--serine O-phosphatidyltransferase [Phaeodactylibacter sp.]|nr:CDP-diacylglycerol--serine O-phosphatidyltransferase [Phaeodactylibacter sp.]